MKIKLLSILIISFLAISSNGQNLPVKSSESDLIFPALAETWDEGMPLGNATIGALVWKNGSSMRLSLDRTDLWDLRPMDSISGPNNRFSWVYEQVINDNYLAVQKKYDHPYDALPAPSKIPGAALEFSLEQLGDPSLVQLYLNNALCEVSWDNGTRMKTFVHATEPVGWFIFENLNTELTPSIIAPKYNATEEGEDLGPVVGLDLRRLGYQQGKIDKKPNIITYHQKGWGGFYYDVTVRWIQENKKMYGTWSITTSLVNKKADNITEKAIKRGIEKDYTAHIKYWNEYWSKSSVNLPDPVLQKQYDNEMYKFGSASREDSYPISLQAVWTADNGKLPPWKGDYHHDLNTQLSYWPAYMGNHLSEGLGYLNTLWDQRDAYKRYTKGYFEKNGMNVPGVATLQGEPMGGWIQYSMSQTVGAWLAQHFYLHWKFSADRKFLKERAYPFLKDAAQFLEEISVVDERGTRKLLMSSSPEIFDNSRKAWFRDMTNYDLSLMHFAFGAASELAIELNLQEEAKHWESLKTQLPDFDVDEKGCLTFAKGFPYNSSHRHFSHAMAIHPLGLIDQSQGEKSQRIIDATIDRLDNIGPDYWVGYSYSWLGNMKARAMDGEGAANALRTFAECFCLKNTFHANGDQTKSGKSKFTYRPFTLEGNFAFASGIQEMLMQSHTGTVHLFPAYPWAEGSFNNLRAMGAFLISAEKKNGKVISVKIHSEQGGVLHLTSQFFGTQVFQTKGSAKEVVYDNNVLTIEMGKGESTEIIPVSMNS